MDPETRVEIPPASGLASRVDKILARWHVKGVAGWFREPSSRDISCGRVALTSAREISLDAPLCFAQRYVRPDAGSLALTTGILLTLSAPLLLGILAGGV